MGPGGSPGVEPGGPVRENREEGGRGDLPAGRLGAGVYFRRNSLVHLRSSVGLLLALRPLLAEVSLHETIL